MVKQQMWCDVDRAQIEALRRVLDLLAPLPSDRLKIRAQVGRASNVEIVDVGFVGDDLGISLLPRRISIGSASHDVDVRYELVDFDTLESFVERAVKEFARHVVDCRILPPK